jgi:hypothetical protein
MQVVMRRRRRNTPLSASRFAREVAIGAENE